MKDHAKWISSMGSGCLGDSCQRTRGEGPKKLDDVLETVLGVRLGDWSGIADAKIWSVKRIKGRSYRNVVIDSRGADFVRRGLGIRLFWLIMLKGISDIRPEPHGSRMWFSGRAGTKKDITTTFFAY